MMDAGIAAANFIWPETVPCNDMEEKDPAKDLEASLHGEAKAQARASRASESMLVLEANAASRARAAGKDKAKARKARTTAIGGAQRQDHFLMTPLPEALQDQVLM